MQAEIHDFYLEPPPSLVSDETDDPDNPRVSPPDSTPSFYESAYVQRRPQGTTLVEYVSDYTKVSNAIPRYRGYYEIYYAGLCLGLCERESDKTQCRRSPKAPRLTAP